MGDQHAMLLPDMTCKAAVHAIMYCSCNRHNGVDLALTEHARQQHDTGKEQGKKASFALGWTLQPFIGYSGDQACRMHAFMC